MNPSASSAAAESSSGAKRRGCPRVVGTRRKFPPSGHPAPAAPCALVRRGRARQITPPRGPPVP
jgi:hypothetical protein